MNHEDLEPVLERLLADAPRLLATEQLRAQVISTTSRVRQRPPWLSSLKEPPMRYRSKVVVGSPALRLLAIVAVTATLLASLAGAGLAAASLLTRPSPESPPHPPVAVTATSAAGSCVDGTTVTIDGVERTRGFVCHPTWTWSDPRLNGKVSLEYANDRYLDGEVTIGSFAYRFENDEGSWRSLPLYLVDGEAVGVARNVFTMVLDGEGAYEGLIAVLYVEDWEPHGYIIEGEIPSAPDIAPVG